MCKKLKNCIKLSHRITVYVPGTDGVNTESDNTEHVKKVASELSLMFGGATASPAIGYWLSSSVGLVAENTNVVFAYAKESDLESHIDQVVTLCEELRDTLKQEAIALEIDGEMYFV